MRRVIAKLAIFLASLSFGQLSAQCNSCVIADVPLYAFNLGIGFRHDHFKFSIGGEDDFPSVLSEIRWSDLRIGQIQSSFSYTTCNNYYIRFYGDYGRIWHGHVKDSDFADDDKQFEFSQIKANGGKGHVWD